MSQRYSPGHKFNGDEQARYDALHAAIESSGYQIYSVSIMGSNMGSRFRHSLSGKSISSFTTGIYLSDAAQEVIAGTFSMEEFMDRLSEATLAAPDPTPPAIDHKLLFRRDFVHCGPNPLEGIIAVRKYYEKSADYRKYGILRIRPEGFSHSSSADAFDFRNPEITREVYLRAWDLIRSAGFELEGEDHRFAPAVCPIDAVLDLDNPRSTSPGLLETIGLVAAEWKSYLDDPSYWHHQQGVKRQAYIAIYLSSDNTPDWLGDANIWDFSSCCPPEDLRGLEMLAVEQIGDYTTDHFDIKMILPRKPMNELALRILGLAIGRPLDLRPKCSHCNRGQMSNGELCDHCFVEKYEAMSEGRPWPTPAPTEKPESWGVPPF